MVGIPMQLQGASQTSQLKMHKSFHFSTQIHKLLSFMQEFIWARVTLGFEKSCLAQCTKKANHATPPRIDPNISKKTKQYIYAYFLVLFSQAYISYV